MENNEKQAYENELYKRLSTSLQLKRQEATIGRYIGKPVWWMVQNLDNGPCLDIKEMGSQCSIAAHSRGACLRGLCDAFAKAKRLKRLEYFKCSGGLSGFCYPIVQGKKIYGYIAMCHAEQEIPPAFIDMFTAFVDALVREIQKELQLSKLYETIRPRAIALSTVHTIHRLLTSTLELDELLPRIARLSLQIVRASRCSIKLVDKAKRVLLPKTTVDLRKKKVKLKKVKVGMYAPGKAFKRGKVIMGKDYISVPMIDQDVIGVITLYDKTDKTPFNHFDKEIMSTLAEQAVIAINNAFLYKDQKRMTEGTIKSLATLLNTQAPGQLTPRSPYIKITQEIGKCLRMSVDELETLEYAYLLHDVGKAILPASVLSKKSKLSKREYKLIKEHPLKGVEIIRPLKTLKPCLPMILHQRERYDGKGYPGKLKGRRIPLGARVIAVTSAFEAMTERRSYHIKMTLRKAVEEIKKNSGTQFDPKVVEAFTKVVNRHHIKEILRRECYGD